MLKEVKSLHYLPVLKKYYSRYKVGFCWVCISAMIFKRCNVSSSYRDVAEQSGDFTRSVVVWNWLAAQYCAWKLCPLTLPLLGGRIGCDHEKSNEIQIGNPSWRNLEASRNSALQRTWYVMLWKCCVRSWPRCDCHGIEWNGRFWWTGW
jgi:hypothetical protein